MLYSEIIAVCYEVCKKHMNTLGGQKVEFLFIQPGGTRRNQWIVKGYCDKVAPMKGAPLGA